MAVFEYRLAQSPTFRTIREELREQDRMLDAIRHMSDLHAEQISGEGGLQNSLRSVRDEIIGLRRALYALTGSIIVGTVSLATAIATHAL